MTKIKDLVKILQKKEQDAEVEFIVLKTNGNIVCMDVEAKSTDLIKMLKSFKNA